MNDVDAIEEQVRMSTVLRDYHVQFSNSGAPEQIHCPFHHPDTNRSARFYPETDSVYCFVCGQTWNVVDFIKDKEELTFVETLRFIKTYYNVNAQTPDYEAQFWAVRKPQQNSPVMMAETVERLFIRYADSLTSGNVYSILTTYNECLAKKDSLTESGIFSNENLTQWYEESVAKLRTENQNG